MRKRKTRHSSTGYGQLTLVEHSLCPLDPATSLSENLIHDVSYTFIDRHRHVQKAHAKVYCPLGLSANDEFFLWGLLSLTISQPNVSPEFYATPHYCLRRLGVIDQHGRRGGRQYEQFLESLTRLSAVVYQNDRFYDPVRAEHRHVSFGLFSFSLPTEPESSRAWRISWNPLFFEFVLAAAGGMRFDLETYRNLEPASRRMFLLLSKIFQRRSVSPRFSLHNLACDVLGFSATVATADLKKKVRRCVERLAICGVVLPCSAESLFTKDGVGKYRVTIERGPYFTRVAAATPRSTSESALFESLVAIGFESEAAQRVIDQYPTQVLQEWADITLAARERFGATFFRKSAVAYFVDNVQHAARSERAAPDWWFDLRKAEARAQAEQHRQRRAQESSSAGLNHEESDDLLKRVGDELYSEFVAAGQDPRVARVNAERFAAEHVRRRGQARNKSSMKLRPELQSFDLPRSDP